ncbi:MAG TPA: M50 family metallopeptidase [Chthoniobacterales bacterium]|jgi:Zn-dependent protease|nr:M50 family metallopeptidase [Chthoniobacterales bacterium]
MPTQGGSFRLFRFAGIDVFLHWSWFLIAAYEVQVWRSIFSSPVWAALLYLGLFVLVTLHEFGHALACRQVGGRADRIVLWPLGGIAFVSPPPRAGAMLWSIAAGPLVNVLLAPILTFILHTAGQAGLAQTNPDGYEVLHWLWKINWGLLLFNLLPIYPLDGGQILRAVLWFPLGQIRSLFLATAVGFAGGAALVLFAIWVRSIWFGIMAFFLLSQAAVGWRQAQYLKTAAAEEVRVAPDERRL